MSVDPLDSLFSNGPVIGHIGRLSNANVCRVLFGLGIVGCRTAIEALNPTNPVCDVHWHDLFVKAVVFSRGPVVKLANGRCGPANVTSEAGAILLIRLAERGEISIKEEVVSRKGFESSLDQDQSRLAGLLRSRLADAALEAPTLRTLADELGEGPVVVRGLGHYLERQNVLIAAPDELFFDRASVLELIQRVVAHFESNEELDTQTLKALIGTSRRTAMPLMALLDDLQITRRDGSIRRLLNKNI